MIETGHSKLIRKLEGDQTHIGIIPTLTKAQMGVSDYFIPSTYKDGSGKENKCYLFTKMGCKFIANKFTVQKGILFTVLNQILTPRQLEKLINKL
ncbi:Rha family transcriptional regulator [Clostridium botulinum]|nr:Rha family transcriptional regulator [Clostridium botulinum]